MHISLNISMTADGKANFPGAKSLQRIGNDADMERLKSLRRESDAILAGSKTIIFDNAALRVDPKSLRIINGLIYPLRIAVIGKTLPDPNSNIFRSDLGGSALIACGKEIASVVRDKYSNSLVIECGNEYKVDVEKLVNILENDYSVKRLLVEGGPTVNSLFFENNLADRYYVTVCPYIFGGKGKIITPVGGNPLPDMESGRYPLIEVVRSEDWLFLTYER